MKLYLSSLQMSSVTYTVFICLHVYLSQKQALLFDKQLSKTQLFVDLDRLTTNVNSPVVLKNVEDSKGRR